MDVAGTSYHDGSGRQRGEYLRNLVDRDLDEVAVPDAVDANTNRFRDMMIADRTVLRLHEFLSEEYHARYEEQAGAKLAGFRGMLVVLQHFPQPASTSRNATH